MQNDKRTGEKLAKPSVSTNRRGGVVQRGLKVAAQRGLTRRVVTKGVELAEKRLPRQLSRAVIFTQVGLVTRGIMLVEWAALALLVLFGASGLWLIFNHNDNIFGAFVLALAFVSFVIWRLVRRGRLFAEQQVARALGIFQQLVLHGEVPAEAWPQWFKQWRKTHSKTPPSSLNS